MSRGSQGLPATCLGGGGGRQEEASGDPAEPAVGGGGAHSLGQAEGLKAVPPSPCAGCGGLALQPRDLCRHSVGAATQTKVLLPKAGHRGSRLPPTHLT